MPVRITRTHPRSSKKVDRWNRHLDGLAWPDQPRDVADLLRFSVGDAHKIARASTDLRSLLTAYSHHFHEPRPVMSEIARAQDATRQGIPRRYGQATVDAISELLSPTPNIAQILDAFPSLSLDDLATLDGPVGSKAARHKSGKEPLVRMSEQRRRAAGDARAKTKASIATALPRTADRED